MDERVGCASFCTCVRARAETDEIEIEIERGRLGGGARRSRRRELTNRVGRASKYKREIDGEGNGNNNNSSSSNCYDIYNCLWSWALKVLDTTQALGALALGEGSGTLNIGTVDL